jgi:hypothetical protein
MNERIKQLAREAGLLAYNPEGPPTKLDKFAELIVRECAGLMDGRRIEYGNCKDGRVILKHFGVEEESW